jgi:hypothetical protein
MSEDVARAVGAGGPEPLIIDGIECKARPLSIRELAEVERDCLSRYRKSYLSTFSENLEMLGEAGPNLLQQKMEEAAKWDIGDLPSKWAHDTSTMPITTKLVDWLKGSFSFSEAGIAKEKIETLIRQMVATALDSGVLSAARYKELVGHEVEKAKVGYVNWWVTGTYDGMISMVWMSVRDNGVSRDAVAKAIGTNPHLFIHASREIEKLTAPSVGNG